MATIDWIIVVTYAIFTVILGWFCSRTQNHADDYFVGSRKMNPLIVGISLFATLLSTISYLAIPGEVLGKGPVYLTNYLAYPFIFLVVGLVILPIYMKQQVTSAYALLEDQLGREIRLLGGTMFLTLRLVWMSLMVHLTSKALAIMIGLDEVYTPLIVIVVSIFAITYTSIGGIRAVVLTDLMQTILLYGGALLVLGTITWKMNGLAWFPTEWKSEIWDIQPIFSLDPSTRVTVFGTVLSIFLWTVCTSAGDQVSIQRFMSTSDAKAARKAIAVQLTVGMVVGVTLGLVGLALLGFYEANQNLLPMNGSIKSQADKLFPHFIASSLPPVVTGFVVSGLLAAAMSSIDSGINSITAVLMNDFFPKRSKGGKQSVAFARRIAIATGILVALLSFIVGVVPGNFMAITNKTVNLLTVPIALLFFFALYVPFASRTGVLIGTFCSITSAIVIAFSGPIMRLISPHFGLESPIDDPISYQWITPVSLFIGLTIGLGASWIFPKRNITVR